jgi:hypothetical protein
LPRLERSWKNPYQIGAKIVDTYTFMAALQAGFTTLLEYLSAHVLTCLIPALAFLFSGPAINIMAILLTARVLGLDLGIARARRSPTELSC